MPKAWSEAATAVLPLAVCFCFWENGLLGEALCRGRSPELTRSAVLVFGGGSGSPPLGGLVFMRAWRCACVARARFLKNT